MKKFEEMGAYAVLDQADNKGVLKYFPTPKLAIADLMYKNLDEDEPVVIPYNENGSQIAVGGFRFGFKSNCTKQPPSEETIAITKFYRIRYDDMIAIFGKHHQLCVEVDKATYAATEKDVKTDKRKKFSEMQSFAYQEKGGGIKWKFCDSEMTAVYCSIFNHLKDPYSRVPRGRMIMGCDWPVSEANQNCRYVSTNGKPVCERYYKISNRHSYKIEIAYMELLLAFDNMNKNLFEGDS